MWSRLFSELIICPSCRLRTLSLLNDGIYCDGCKKKYKFNNGIPCLYTDEFSSYMAELKERRIEDLDVSDAVIKSNIEFHNDNAGGYDEDPAIEHLLSESGKSLIRDCIKHCKEKTDGLVWIDAGCGTGQIMSIAQEYKFATTIGIDFSEGMALVAKSKEHNVILSDVCNLPIDDRSVDLVSACALLHHLPEPKVFLQEAYRILKPYGRLFTDFDPNNRPDHDRQVIKALRKILRKYRMKRESIHTIDRETYEKSCLADFQMNYNYNFNGETIEKLLLDIGFEDIRVDYYFDKAGLEKPDQPPFWTLLRRMVMSKAEKMFDRKEISPLFLTIAKKPK